MLKAVQLDIALAANAMPSDIIIIAPSSGSMISAYLPAHASLALFDKFVRGNVTRLGSCVVLGVSTMAHPGTTLAKLSVWLIQARTGLANFGAASSEPALLVDGQVVLATSVPDSSGLSSGAIAGIAIVVLLLCSATVAGVWYHKTKSAPATTTSQLPSAVSDATLSAPHRAECVAIPLAMPVADTKTAALHGMPQWQHTGAHDIRGEGELVGMAQFV
jgi:hypothetical protein